MGAGFLWVTWGYLVELSTIKLSKTYSARFVGTDHMVERVATNVAATDSSRKIVPSPVTHSSIATRSSGSRGGQVGHGVSIAWTSSHGWFPCASILARISAEFGRAVSDDPCGVLLRTPSRGVHVMSGAGVITCGRATFPSLAFRCSR